MYFCIQPHTILPLFIYNLLLMSAVVSLRNAWLQDFASFGNPWIVVSVTVRTVATQLQVKQAAKL